MSTFDDEGSMSASSDGSGVGYSGSDPDQKNTFDSTTGSGGETRTKSSSEGGLLSRMSNTAVVRSKLLVYIVLALAAAGFATAVYFLLTAEETDDFETQFGDFADEILRAADSNARDYLGSLKGIGNALTSYSVATGAMWPNVTLPNFDLRTTKPFEELVGPEAFIFAPIVTKAELTGFESYAWDNQDWIDEDLELRGLGKINHGTISTHVYPFMGELEAHFNAEVHVPIWQLAPVPTNAQIINLDLYSHPSFKRLVDEGTEVRHLLLSEVVDGTFIAENMDTLYGKDEMDQHPRSYAAQPVFRDFKSHSNLVGFIFAVVPWWTYFVDILPLGVEGYVVEIQDSCGSPFFYRLDGPEAFFLEDFQPSSEFEHLAPSEEFAVFARYTADDASDEILHCSYHIIIHPTPGLKTEYETNRPIVYAMVVLAVFAVTLMVFILYGYFVERRQHRVMRTAQKTSAIVSSLFPKNVQGRIMAELQESDSGSRRSSRRFSGKDLLKNFLGNDLDEDENGNGIFGSKPIADYFAETSIIFADLVGFTSWSSTREPQAVFTLLETIYHEFDEVANRRRVFKVETIGDCYVAVTGLPEARRDHAVCMARFAQECLKRLGTLLRRLEVELGPDTGDLAIRIGIHSGPVTAGVLRGERARFQLFGDTMNTAARMESTGAAGRIQVSQETAELLVKAGKEHWIHPREELIEAKGKGTLQTYWLKTSMIGDAGSVPSKSSEAPSDDEVMTSATGISFLSKWGEHIQTVPEKLSAKALRLVDWNVDILIQNLQEIEARRLSTGAVADRRDQIARLEREYTQQSCLVIKEVQEIITLPEFAEESIQYTASSIKIDEQVKLQLRKFLLNVGSMYHSNPFHNFEHASHVTMSIVKLFSRIVAPDKDKVAEETNKCLHDHTYGITSDPLTQFAVIFAGLIHDLDHRGIPNTQLTKEKRSVAEYYEHQSVAEQNSVDMAWTMLMLDDFKELRYFMYKTTAELQRFRQLVVNAVLATDIMDKELKVLRNNRWEKAFSGDVLEESYSDKTNRKATIVIEHLIQASDVSHTMQHWHIYTKWNTKLFKELYKAYLSGQAENDPSEFWYKGEIGFFDFYIIPLAKKLKDCGVFGVSSDEYLNYATNNRNEWVRKGPEFVEEMIRSVKEEFDQRQNKKKEDPKEPIKESVGSSDGQPERSTKSADPGTKKADLEAKSAIPGTKMADSGRVQEETKKFEKEESC